MIYLSHFLTYHLAEINHFKARPLRRNNFFFKFLQIKKGMKRKNFFHDTCMHILVTSYPIQILRESDFPFFVFPFFLSVPRLNNKSKS